MKKQYRYPGLRFSADALREAYDAVSAASPKVFTAVLTVHASDDTEYDYDTIDEFEAAYSQSKGDARIAYYGDGYTIDVMCSLEGTDVLVIASRAFIQAVFDIFDRNKTTATKVISIFADEEAPPAKPIIFIGHVMAVLRREF